MALLRRLVAWLERERPEAPPFHTLRRDRDYTPAPTPPVRPAFQTLKSDADRFAPRQPALRIAEPTAHEIEEELNVFTTNPHVTYASWEEVITSFRSVNASIAAEIAELKAKIDHKQSLLDVTRP